MLLAMPSTWETRCASLLHDVAALQTGSYAKTAATRAAEEQSYIYPEHMGSSVARALQQLMTAAHSARTQQASSHLEG